MDHAVQVRHIVLFKFQLNITPATIDQIVDAFKDLPGRIELILDFESGTNISPEHLDQGYTHAFVLTFANSEARDAYLVHPVHVAFAKMLEGQLDQALVFDFEVGN